MIQVYSGRLCQNVDFFIWFKLYFFVYTSYMYMTTEELQYSNVIVIYKWDSEESLLTYICLYPIFFYFFNFFIWWVYYTFGIFFSCFSTKTYLVGCKQTFTCDTSLFVLIYLVAENFWKGGSIWSSYCTYPQNSNRQAWANSVDPDQMPQNAESDQGLHGFLWSSNFRHVYCK